MSETCLAYLIDLNCTLDIRWESLVGRICKILSTLISSYNIKVWQWDLNQNDEIINE